LPMPAMWANPDLIITDVQMPSMDGFEATKLILERRPSARVVLADDAPDGKSFRHQHPLSSYSTERAFQERLLHYFELDHHVVILVLDVVAVDDVLPPAVLEFHDDPYRLIRPEQDRILPV